MSHDSTPPEPIAVVGMACRFPGGASSPSELWKLLCEGFDGIVDIPTDRWDARRFYAADASLAGKMIAQRGGFLQQKLDQFDAQFFHISPREANFIDPQQRLLLETSWEALEDAGVVPATLKGSQTGVFIGAFTTDWQNLQNQAFNIKLGDLYTGINASQTVLSARLSYFYDFKGPCLTTDTACSSSLVAIHLACSSLWNGECSQALAGGVNAMLIPEPTIAMSKGRFLNPSAQCRSFDNHAKGYVRGEGAGIVILKPLSAALKDGDPIYAVIRGTGMNHDGHTNGLALPNSEAQKTLISTVLQRAKVDPAEIQYVEAHGTGTPVGDPAEAWALNEVLHSTARAKCWLGSIKSNIGHLEAAAGVAGFIKAVMCLKQRLVPPNLHFTKPNPAIPFDQYCLQVPVSLSAFPEPAKTLYAAVNSFGYGGTNAHVVLQEHPEVKPAATPIEVLERPFAFPLSGATQEALQANAGNVAAFLHENPHSSVADVALTLCKHRQQHHKRACVMAQTTQQLQQYLAELHARGTSPHVFTEEGLKAKANVAFVYTGMGPQWHGMGQQLMAEEAIFRQTMEQCDQLLRPLAGWSLLEELAKDEISSNMALSQYAQPANFAIQAALTELLRSWDIIPQAVVGHSIGEVGAAYAAGGITLAEGVLISFHRSRIQSRRQGLGTMLAVELKEEDALHYVEKYPNEVFIAAVNSATSLTLSGEVSALQAIAADLDAQGIFHRFLTVNIAYHSGQMDGLEGDVLQSLSAISPCSPKIPYYSTVTGDVYHKDILDAHYWWKNIRQPVLFHQTLLQMLGKGCNVFIEIGPHPVLGKSIKETIVAANCEVKSLYTLNRREMEGEALARLVGRLYMSGYALSWQHLLPESARRIALPGYAWQRQHFWSESENSKQYYRSLHDHPMLSRRCESPTAAWTVEVNRAFFPWLEEHKLDDSIVFPGAAYVEAGLALHKHHTGTSPCILENLKFSQALVVTAGTEPLLRSSLVSDKHFQIHALINPMDDSWQQLATGEIHAPWKDYLPEPLLLAAIRAKCRACVPQVEVYRHFEKHGMQYGPAFQRIHTLYQGKGEALAEITVPDYSEPYHLPPPVLDAALQALVGTRAATDHEGLALPVGIEQLHFFATPPPGRVWCYAKETERTAHSFKGDLTICDAEGNILVELRGVCCRVLKKRQLDLQATLERMVYSLAWKQSARQASQEVLSLIGQYWQVVCPHANLAQALRAALQSYGAGCDATPQADVTHLLYYCPPNHSASVDYQSSHNLLKLVKEWDTSPHSRSCSLWIVTHGVQRVVDEDVPDTIGDSALWGLASVMRHEMPHLNCRVLDIGSAMQITDIGVIETLCRPPAGFEMALRADTLYVPALERFQNDVNVINTVQLHAKRDAFQLELSKPGSIEHLHYQQTLRRSPLRGEVEIQVHTSSLNFKDLMKVLGLLEDDVLAGTYFGNSFGMECSGTVVAVGPGVRNVKVGETVCAFTRNTFSSFLVVSKDAICPIPPGTTMEEAPIYIPFITVVRGLKEVAKLKASDTLLIHTATGAVGLAAVQYAQHVGAKIIATAGSEEKRKYLNALGITHVADSRSLHFSRQVRAWTDGKGVDVVLNALSGEALLKSWELLASYGRFIEIGKRDISLDTGLPMHVFHRNATFAAIDLDCTFAEDRRVIRRLLRETMRYFAAGVFKPLPCEIFKPEQVQDAFHFLARAKHMGKVAIRFDEERVQALPLAIKPEIFYADATYLVTGGLSGFGLATAQWIVEKGGRHLLLLSRQGATSKEAQTVIHNLKEQGVKVKVAAVDVGVREQIQAKWPELMQGMPPLKGVFHCAMVLDDGWLQQLEAARLQAVMHPKVAGCWNLHLQTKNDQLDYFVLYSSISSLIGNPGQGNYAAANAFLDAFSHYRHARKLPALTINWGAIADVGVVARQDSVAAHLQSSGITAQSTKVMLQVLEYLLQQPNAQYAVMDVDWHRLCNTLPTLKEGSKFAALKTDQMASGDTPLTHELLAMDAEMQLQTLISFIGERVAYTLKMDVSKVDADAKLTALGVDSLMAMELQHQMEQKLSCKIPTMELMKGPSIKELSRSVQKLLPLRDRRDIRDSDK